MGEVDSAHDDGFIGAASVLVGEHSVDVQVSLRGYFEPLDGRYHWYGRLAADAALAELVGSGKATGQLSTPFGTADCALGDVDPWGRLRVTGISTPPFATAQALVEDRGHSA